MSKCQKCREEEEAGMACLSCPCSSTFATTSGTVDRSTAELNLKDLAVLDMMQLQNLCVKGNLVSSGNRATLIDRLLDRFYHPWQEFSVLIIWLFSSIFCSYGPRQLQLIKRLYAAPSVEPLPLVSTPELNNNGQQKTSSQIPSDLVGEAEVEYKNAQNVGVEDKSMSFPCNFCESGFPTRTSLKNHTRRAHRKQRREMSEVRLLKRSY